MILAQFHLRYPTGSLISDLLTIYQGKFVIRVSIQIDGVTRATGIAAAETPEEAEDKARSRAIAIMAIEPATSSPIAAIPTQSAPVVVPESPLPAIGSEPLGQHNFNSSSAWSATDPVPELYEAIAPPPAQTEPAAATLGTKTKSKRSPLASNPPEPEENVFGEFGLSSHPQTQSISTPAPVSSNVTSIAPQGDRTQFDFESEIQTNTSEPIDLSDDLAAIGVLLNELRWKPDIESKFLQRNYGKTSRHELTPEQVKEFRRYLELFSQTDKQLRKLNWGNEKGRTYLAQTYNKKSRQELTYEQLHEFLEYLQSEGD